MGLPKGFRHTLETRQKMSATRLRLYGRGQRSCKRCGTILQKRSAKKYCSHTCYIEQAREDFRSGVRQPWCKGLTLPEATLEKLRSALLGNKRNLGHRYRHSEEARLKISQKAIEGYRLGQRAVPQSLKMEFLDRHGRLWKMRSSWERRVAEELDRQQLAWVYEPCRLLLSSGRTYLPDFWVHEWNRYLEVKAIWRANALEKVECAIGDGHDIVVISNVDKWIRSLSPECEMPEEAADGVLA